MAFVWGCTSMLNLPYSQIIESVAFTLIMVWRVVLNFRAIALLLTCLSAG